jgi:hypothetical protein
MTSPVDTTVKYFHSAMPSAPQLSGTVGSLIGILDACLVTGFGLKNVDSIVVTSNVAVVTISTGHSAEVGTVMLLSGVTVPAALNGEQKVTAISATTFSFATTGVSDQTATGTITCKAAPAGWSKAYSGTNLAAYKSTDVTSTGQYLRVDDTATGNARVSGFETMSDVNTGSGQFPTPAQRTGGLYWPKSSGANATSRNWMVATDGKRFYMAVAAYLSTPNDYFSHMFGDLIPTKTNDPYCCSITGYATDVATVAPALLDSLLEISVTNPTTEAYVSRSYTGLGSSCRMRKTAYILATNVSNWQSGSVTQSNAMMYPHPEDGGLYVSPYFLLESTSISLRGRLPGYHVVPMYVPNGLFSARDSITGVTGLPGRTLRAFIGGAGEKGLAFFDTTGPWV